MKSSDYWSFIVVAVAAGFFGGVFVSVASFFFAVGTTFCAEAEKACVREWVGALSGWAGFAAAAFTVAYLVQQIRDTNRHQQENVALQIMGKLAFCRRLERELRIPLISVKYLSKATDNSRRLNGFAFYRECTSAIEKTRNIPFASIERFEDEIGFTGGVTTKTFQNAVSDLQNAWDEYKAADPPRDYEMIEAQAQKVLKYIDIVRARMTSFVNDWAGRAGEVN